MAEQPPEEQKLQVRDVEKLKEVLAAEPPPPPSEEVVQLPADPPPPPSPTDEAATQVVETRVQPPPNATPSTIDRDQHPHLADGVELLGEYEGSGFKEPRYNARRAGGEMVQLTELLYLIAEAIDGRRSYEEIATQVSEKYGKKVSADNVKTLIDNNLGPDGFVAGFEAKEDGPKVDPLLALKFRLTLFPERAVAFVSALLRPLFWPPLIIAALVGFVMLDIWYFGHHGVAQSLRDLIYQPLIVLMVYAVLIVSVLWHELGHATACRYGGAKPGRIGFGIYIVWPAFFTDVTDALKLGKGGRVRTDLGGIYFNILFSLAVGGIYTLTGFEPILVLIVMQHLMILYNLMPFLRLDGYHAISDLTGIPDLFARIKPTVEGLVPFKETPNEVTELKPWARTVVTVWVLMVIPVLLYVFSMMVLSVPRVVATGLDSLNQQWDKVGAALDKGAIATVAVGAIQSLMIVLPAMGMGFSFFRIGRRIGSGFIEMTSERPILRTAFGIVGLSALTAAAFVLIPNGEYKPIQSDETWTV
ncbi:MAG: putative peptide zinc metalloprotease protein, partial [Actinomycetota bacterium]|nr:putative peptide zinc metalloprotease protein [Actinomycetota bacterium]